MPFDHDLDRTSLVRTSPRRQRLSRTAAPRAALAFAALLVLALTFVPRAGASVYWSNATGAAIGRANGDGTALNPAFVGDVANPCGVASDGAHVYWTNRADRAIARANVDGSGINRRFITGVDSCALAVDAAHIYWDNLNTGSIGRANLDGTGVNSGFIPSVGASFGVAVDRAHVYWSAFGSIGRANLDGTGANRAFIAVDPRADQTCGVAVDAGHVYWANDLGTIARANLDGSGRNESFVRTAPARSFVCGVAVDSAHLYWAHSGLDAPDTVNDGIGRADLDGTNVVHTFIAASEPRGIAVDTARQAVPPSRIAIGDVRQSEGDAGQTAFQFPLTLDSPQPSPVTVGFATADDVATAPGDYAATAGTVTFDPGETAKTATVQVNGDTAVEPDETFAVNLSDAGANGTIADGRAVGTIVNDDPSGTPGTLPGPTGCSAMNGSDVQIPDLATVESPLRISGCAGNASAAATVEVHIVHTFIGDLIVSLVAPDGSSYILHNRAGGATRDINQTYTVNLSSEPADGTWRLRVQDAAPGDVGRIDSWSVNLTGIPTPTPSPTPSPSPTPTPPPAPSPAPSPTPPGCSATNGSDVQIPDLATVESPIGISSCTRSASATATVEVHIVHTFIGDLVVSLVAPDGTTYVLQNRTGFNAHDINQSYIVNLSSEQGEGTWRLRVQDAAAGDVGHIDAWTLSL